MPYFDLHCHPSLKPMFAKVDTTPSCWDNIVVNVDNIFANVLDSQSSLSQITGRSHDKTAVNLAVVALHATEKAIVQQGLLRFIARIAGDFLDNARLRNLASRPKMHGGFEQTYYSLMNDELTNLLKNTTCPDNKKKIKIINSYNEYDAADKNTLHIILAVEGSHCFWGMENMDDYIYNVDVNKMTSRLEEFVSQYRLFYITLTHLMPNKFFNHAYGLKMFNKNDFLPVGNGITDDGKFFIEKCYENNVLVDIKHLSLKARQDFYNYRDEDEPQPGENRKPYKDIPIIASHMAVTGIRWEDAPKYVDYIIKHPQKKYVEVVHKIPKGHFGNITFNPSSINLYDNDIEKIADSEGLIGLILDERVLGDSRNKGYNEYVSWDEKDLFIKNNTKQKAFVDDTNINVVEIENIEYNEAFNIDRYLDAYDHADLLLNNIFHIVKVINKHKPGADAWKYICIGTDFDGLINPINICTDVSQLYKIEDMLVKNLKGYANGLGIPLNDTPANIAHKIMYENGRRFIEENFK